MKIFVLFLTFFTLNSLALGKEIKIASTPSGAEVWVRPMGNLNFQKIGETPYTGNLKEIIDNYAKSDIFVIELRKIDHQVHRYIMSDITHASADVEIVTKLELVDDYATMIKFDEAAQGMFEVQRLIRSKSYDSAISKLDELLKKFPRLSILYELKGSAFYLNKRPLEALELYKEAFKYNPMNFDAFKMKDYLEKTLNSEAREKQ